jgi:hypothetical protein
MTSLYDYQRSYIIILILRITMKKLYCYVAYWVCITTLFLLFVSLTGCTVQEMAISQGIQLGQVSYLLNGKTYKMEGQGNLLINTQDQTNNSLVMTATNTEKEIISLNINGFDTQKPYQVSQNIVIGFGSNGVTKASNLCPQIAQSNNTSILITDFNLQNKTVKGSFWGLLCDSQNRNISISNGQFFLTFE